MSESFDPYSKNYNELVDQAIRHTGYDADNLVSAKLYKLKTLFPTLSQKSFQLLDFGCGVGNLFGHLKEFFPNSVYIGVDLSKDSLKKARSRFPANTNFHEKLKNDHFRQKSDLLSYLKLKFQNLPHSEFR